MSLKQTTSFLLAFVLFVSPLATSYTFAKGGKSGGGSEKKAEKAQKKQEVKVHKQEVKQLKKDLKQKIKQEKKAGKVSTDQVVTEEEDTTDEITNETENVTTNTTDEEEALPKLRRVKNGAQFMYDPATGLVTLTTPSGNQHLLSLPQTAIANMFRNAVPVVEEEEGTEDTTTNTTGNETTNTADTTEDATETTNEVGEMEVTQTVSEIKYLLGLFPVTATKEITVNTETGEIAEADTSILDWIVNTLSF